MNRGTIIYIGGFELPDRNAAAHRVLNNAKILRELGYNIVFIDINQTINSNTEITSTFKTVQEFECWSIPYPVIKKDWIKYLTSIDNCKKIFAKYKNIKAVICYNYPAFAFYKLFKHCKIKQIKVIGDCTEWYSAKGNGILFYLIKSFDTFFRMRIVHKKVDGLIVISDYLNKYYSKCSNVINIPPLVDMTEYKWFTETAKNIKFYNFVYSGSPGNKDKIELIIQAFSRVNFDFRLDIIGITKAQYLQCHKHHDEILSKLENKVYFMGRLDHLAALEYVKNADFSIFFRDNLKSNNAGFPTKFVESISCGTPVICNNSSNIRKYVNELNCGICIDRINPDDIVYAINRVKVNDDYLNINIDRYVFDYKKYIHQMDAFIKTVISE